MRGRNGEGSDGLVCVGKGLDTEFAIEMGSGGNFFLLLAVYGAQPSPLCQHRGRRPGRRSPPQLPGAGTGRPHPSLLPPQGRDESVLGWKQNKDTWFALSFKEHLFLGKVLGPRVAGGAAGSAWRRHGRFCCAFLKERKEETSQPTLSLKPLCFQGWRLAKDSVQPVTTRFSLLPTKPDRMKEGRQQSFLQPCPPGASNQRCTQEPMGKKRSPSKPNCCLLLSPTASQEGQFRANLPRTP